MPAIVTCNARSTASMFATSRAMESDLDWFVACSPNPTADEQALDLCRDDRSKGCGINRSDAAS
jgi:hypothetical protein